TEERQAAGDQLIQELMNKYQAYVRGDDYTFNNAESRYIRAVRGMRVAEEERAALRRHQASIVLDSEATGAFLDSFKTRDDAIEAIATQMDKGLIGGDLRTWMKEETIRRSKQVEQERKRELQEAAAGPLDRSWNRIIDRAGEMALEPQIGERITPTTEGEDRGSRFPRIGGPSLGQGMRPDAPGGTYVDRKSVV